MKHLFKALAEFQQEVPVIHKGTQGYGYSYADLPSIFQVINPLLKKHGLGFYQNLESDGSFTYLRTVVFHVESAEKIESTCEIPRISLAKMNDYQAFGSGITYFRRYCLASCLALITDLDSDAQGQQFKGTAKVENEKIKLSVNQFNNLVGAIKSGQKNQKGDVYTVELANKWYDLTEEQKQTLKTL